MYAGIWNRQREIGPRNNVAGNRAPLPDQLSYSDQHGPTITGAFAAAGLTLIDLIEAGSCQSSREFAEIGVGAAIVHTVCLGPKRPRHLHVFDLGQTLGLADIAVIRRKFLPLTDSHKHLIEILRRHAQKA